MDQEDKETIETAEHLTAQRFLSKYLDPIQKQIWTFDDMCITARKVPNRFGVPDDAGSWEYKFQAVEEEWTVHIRAIWRKGTLLKPRTNLVYVRGVDDEDRHGGPDNVRRAYRDWLKSLPL